MVLKADLALSVGFEEISVLFCFVLKSWKQETGRNLKKAVESIASIHTVREIFLFLPNYWFPGNIMNASSGL